MGPAIGRLFFFLSFSASRIVVLLTIWRDDPAHNSLVDMYPQRP